MYIGTIPVGHRIGLGVIDEDRGRFSMGVSMAGTVKTENYTASYTDVILTFPLMSEATQNTLKAYLNTVKQGGMVTVTPDGTDDLHVGASGISGYKQKTDPSGRGETDPSGNPIMVPYSSAAPTFFLYLNMRAVRLSANTFRTEVMLRFIGITGVHLTGYRQKLDPLGRPVFDKAGRPWMVPYFL
jgi:hypothetical protein